MRGDERPSTMRFVERVRRSRMLRGIVRLHAGFSLVRSWAADVRITRGTAVHLFDYLLYRIADTDEPFEEWLRTRELSSP
jgi:hypothetical protein